MAESHEQLASRAGTKLAHALDRFHLSAQGLVCADLGCSTGGFVDCLLRRGAAKIFAVDRGYGVLAYSLRCDPRVTLMERTDALHVRLPDPIDLVTIDVGWTPQERILPAARRLLAPDGSIVTLVKPQYEARPEMLDQGILRDEYVANVLGFVRSALPIVGLTLADEVESPIKGTGGNREWLWHLRLSGS